MSMKILALDGLNDSKLCKLMGSLLQTIPGVDYANIDYLSQKLTLQMSGRDTARIVDRVSIMIKENMPGVSIKLKEVSNLGPEEKPNVHKDSGMHLDIAKAISTMVNEDKTETTKTKHSLRFEHAKPEDFDDFAPASFKEVAVTDLNPEQIKQGQSIAPPQREETIEEVIAQMNKEASEESELHNSQKSEDSKEAQNGENIDNPEDATEALKDENADKDENEDNEEKEEKIPILQKILAKISKEMFLQLCAIAVSILLAIISLPFKKDSVASFAFGVIPFVILAVFAMICDPGKHRITSVAAPLLTIVASAVLFFSGGRFLANVSLLLYHAGYFAIYFLYERTYNEIESSINIRPKMLTRVRDKVTEVVPFDEVWSGDEIILKKGDTIPFDSIVTSGNSTVDDSFISGKSDPIPVAEGAYLNCGSVILGDDVHCAQVGLQESSIASVVRCAVLEDNPHATRLSQQARLLPVFFALVQLLITLAAIVFFVFENKIDQCVYFLPIAILLLTPTGLSSAVEAVQHAALSRALKNGIVVVSSAILEELSQIKTVITGFGGILTKDDFHVSDVKLAPDQISEDEEANDDAIEELIQCAAYAEFNVEHPIAKAITDYYAQKYEKPVLSSRIAFCETNFGGVRTMAEARLINIGNERYMGMSDIEIPANDTGAACVYVSKYGEHIGSIYLRDEKQEGAERLGHSLKMLGIEKAVLVTGREKSMAESVGKKCGYDIIYADADTNAKISAISSVVASELSPNSTIYAGNNEDVEFLAKICPCIAMGENCLTSMFYVAKALIPCGEPKKLAKAFRIAKETQLFSLAGMGILFAIKLISLVLSLFGIMPFLVAAMINVIIMILQAACPTLMLKK